MKALFVGLILLTTISAHAAVVVECGDVAEIYTDEYLSPKEVAEGYTHKIAAINCYSQTGKASQRRQYSLTVLTSHHRHLFRDILGPFGISSGKLVLEGVNYAELKGKVILTGTRKDLKTKDGTVKGHFENARVRGLFGIFKNPKIKVILRPLGYVDLSF